MSLCEINNTIRNDYFRRMANEHRETRGMQTCLNAKGNKYKGSWHCLVFIELNPFPFNTKYCVSICVMFKVLMAIYYIEIISSSFPKFVY